MWLVDKLVHMDVGKANHDFVRCLVAVHVHVLVPTGHDHDAAIGGRVLGTPDELWLRGSSSRDSPLDVGPKVLPGCDVNIGAELERERNLRVYDRIDRRVKIEESLHPVLVNRGDGAFDLLHGRNDRPVGYSTHRVSK